ncbi:hypothetical protein [Stappia indica]|uniref:hypothetical protein n=1 Tax=Stappia indica TaxID=538381 RepID=UPI0011470892|nr:hypothetical protein [Stappia indica]MCC4243432.1 hypothetical protein [Stappia indica]
MTTGDVSWLAGAVIALVTMIGGIIARDRQLARMIQDGDEKLHDRINRVREDMVHRSDLDGHIQRLDKSVGELRSDVKEQGKETTRRLDTLVTLLSKPPQ